MVRKWFALAAVAALAACASATDAGLAVDYTVVEPAPSWPQVPEADTGLGTIELRGTFHHGACYTGQTERAHLRGGTITFSIRQQGTDVPCIGVMLSQPYQATLRGLDPGTYRLRVEHHDQTVLETDVTVPERSNEI